MTRLIGRLERYYACRHGREAARVDVQRAEVLLEVNVEPLAAGVPRVIAGDRNESCRDAAVARGRRDHGVLDPGVNESVPRHVHEAHELRTVTRDDPAKAVSMHELCPVPLRLVVNARLEANGVKLVDLDVAEAALPGVVDVTQTQWLSWRA